MFKTDADGIPGTRPFSGHLYLHNAVVSNSPPGRPIWGRFTPVAVRRAAALYILDHLFFSLAIAIKTYFQKIADPADMASTAGVAFTINHIAAVVIPVIFGLIWLVSPAAVFLLGAAMVVVSLVLAQNIPVNPREGNEVLIGKVPV